MDYQEAAEILHTLTGEQLEAISAILDSMPVLFTLTKKQMSAVRFILEGEMQG